MDEWRPAQYHVAALLERGIRVLVYVGKNDFICNHVGNKAWVDELEWTGGNDYASQPMREWLVNGKPAGVTKGAHGLTFAIIDGAGHMVRPLTLLIARMLTLAQRLLTINQRNYWRW